MNMSQTLLSACSRLLRPLVVLLLRHGVGFNAFSDMVKKLYIDVAKTHYALPGKKQTASRISTMTGLSRKEVSRISQLPDWEEDEALYVNRAVRVIGGWVRDQEFLDTQGEPMDLEFEGEDEPSFATLVKRYSGDITPRTIADELMRVGAISVTGNNKIRLTQKAYVPNSSEVQKITMLGNDVADLIQTIDHNITHPGEARFQRKVEYEHIDLTQSPQLPRLLNEQAQRCLEDLQETIVKNGKMNKGKTGRRLGVGIYYFEKEQDDNS